MLLEVPFPWTLSQHLGTGWEACVARRFDPSVRPTRELGPLPPALYTGSHMFLCEPPEETRAKGQSLGGASRLPAQFEGAAPAAVR